MPADFVGRTAESYENFRRDVPDTMVDSLVDHFHLGPAEFALDLGAGTGQLTLPLARRLGTVIGMDPEPDMLARLRRRVLSTKDAGVEVLTVLGADTDLKHLRTVLGEGRLGSVTAVNALHWMSPELVFGEARRLLRPGGGMAVVTHGTPMWLADSAWAKQLRSFLEEWLGRPATDSCGSDEVTQNLRASLLAQAGFEGITVLEQKYRAVITPDYVAGHLLSALSEASVPPDRRRDFETGVTEALSHSSGEVLEEHVSVVALVGQRP